MIVHESFYRDVLRLFVWYPLRWVITLLPLRLAFMVFNLMGDMHFMVARGEKRRVLQNLNSAFQGRISDRELWNVARKYFRNHYVNQLQIFLFPGLNLDSIGKFHAFEGLSNLNNALKGNKGCILVHPHFGPAQLPLCNLGLLGYRMMQLGLPTDEGRSFVGRNVAFRLRLKYEAMIPAKIISAESFLRPVMEWLNKNKVLMITGDGAGGGKFIGKFMPMEFLGTKLLMPAGAATLAFKTGAPILPMFTVINKNGYYKTIICEPLNSQEEDVKEMTVEKYMACFAKEMERYILAYPYLWHFWDEWDSRLAK
ncbi:MAG: lysophospholipid acyltransferase family protein [Nitrospirae bacterium]|nr:lysophospholipid acyltransferase family protein [Nitrospirota bacterium]